MLVVLQTTKDEVSLQAARMIAGAIRRNPCVRLGLATGGTMIGVYRELVRLHRQEKLDFSRAVTFNLDEYLGIPPSHPQSFHSFMQQHLFAHVNIPHASIHIPDGTVTRDYDAYCEKYEQAIRDAGGIDLQLLGIGRNGHIGFNEPMSSLGSRTRMKELSAETIEDNRRAFGSGEEMPQCAITVGIGTILETRRIVLLATGTSKADAIAKSIEGPVSASVTASALQLHRDVTYIVDQEAGSQLTQKAYYNHVLKMTRALMPERLS
jgi:glucosamine-6-phosphate deaminase